MLSFSVLNVHYASVGRWLIAEVSHVKTARPSELLRERALSNYTDYFYGAPTPVQLNCSLTYLRQTNTQRNMSHSVDVGGRAV